MPYGCADELHIVDAMKVALVVIGFYEQGVG